MKKLFILTGVCSSLLIAAVSGLIACSSDDEDDLVQFLITDKETTMTISYDSLISIENTRAEQTIDFKELSVMQGVTVTGIVDSVTYVDLGLSVKWATYNVGAKNTSAYGNYFAWGETMTKDDYSWNCYKFCRTKDDLTKYCDSKLFGKVDDTANLMPVDDAATRYFGKVWRTPTFEEMEELRKNCTWEWIDNFNETQTAGALGTSKKNGNTIFLPAAGYAWCKNVRQTAVKCNYWTATSNNSSAYALDLDEEAENYSLTDRALGMPIRAVANK